MGRRDLDALVNAAIAARPGLERHAVATHLSSVLPQDGDVAIEDLALAIAALHGDPAAVAELYALVERAARPALAAARYTSTIVDDAVQETSIQLLVGPAGDGRPLLLGYQGRAGLPAWIKTIALRTAARLVGVSNRLRGDDTMIDEIAGIDDPARDVLKAEIRPAVRRAFAAAVRSLSYSERELLAAVTVRGKTIDHLARTNGVHRATAARWVGRARAALDDALRRELAATLALPESEVSGVLTAIATSIELTPGRLTRVGDR